MIPESFVTRLTQRGRPGQQYQWPFLESSNGTIQMHRGQGVRAGVNGGHNALDLEQGYYAVEDSEDGSVFLFQWSAELCPYLWMWLVYGGWRGHHHVIIEPWTSYPNTLRGAAEANTHRQLRTGETFSVEMKATVYSGSETHLDALRTLGDSKATVQPVGLEG